MDKETTLLLVAAAALYVMSQSGPKLKYAGTGKTTSSTSDTEAIVKGAVDVLKAGIASFADYEKQQQKNEHDEFLAALGDDE